MRTMVRALIAAALALPILGSYRPATAQSSDVPEMVAVAGTVQTQLGCPGDWQPECAASALVYDAEGDVWMASFDLEAGSYEYKVALNGSWDENYGLGAEPSGPNISLKLAEAATVTFIYDHKTHWIADSVSYPLPIVAGDFQDEVGCAADESPTCWRSWLQDPDGDGVFVFTAGDLPAGDYSARLILGADAPARPALPFSIPSAGGSVSFAYNAETDSFRAQPGVISPGTPVVQPPSQVVIPGTLQSKLGCPGDWQPECASTALAYNPVDEIWRGAFDMPAGSYEYKVALNGAWTENYGALAQRNGANIPLVLDRDATIRFYYDHATHWVADSATSVIASVIGDFQTELGCPEDWRADCLRGWLQDPDADGIYSFSTSALSAGDYAVQVALDEGAGPVYGQDGVEDGARIAFRVPKDGQLIYFGFDPESRALSVSTTGAPRGNLSAARAHWVARDVIAWKLPAHAPGTSYWLHFAPEGGLKLGTNGVEGGETLELAYFDSKVPIEVFAANPHLSGYSSLKLAAADLARVPEILKGQIAVSARDAEGEPIDATSLQISGVLDDLYAYDGPLGATLVDGAPTLRLWAPTAKDVILHLFEDATTPTDTTIPLALDPATGVWSVVGETDWVGRYYLYEVAVYVPRTGQVERNLVTDPYSLSLAINSTRSQIVDLTADALKPQGWDTVVKPALDAPEDAVIYELHIRDFSLSDETVPPEMRGTYLAFTQPEAAGMQHLRALAGAGLTHIHLLPTFDIASVDEDRSTWQSVDPAVLGALPPESGEQANAVGAIRDSDGFNWGYDPFHYTVPEGSYATQPEGASRVVEFRSMVQALNQVGLRVVMDVVYNHTTASGQDAKSVLDRIVPGYYHRLNADGQVETSTCCQNTATEHAMMEKLMIDSVVTWATAYKVDGFRFDLMGHHLRVNMEHVRAALDALTLEADGVDGRAIVLYGEGWDFGEVAANARGVNATQLNLGGAGIGLFNDRLRDGVRGGGPFSGLQEQGYATGLSDDANDTPQGDVDEQHARLLRYADWIRIGLAGNLADYGFEDRTGRAVVGSEIDYNGSPAGYTQDPQENILYVSAHDNETLFDAIQFKASTAATMADRVRMQNLANSLVMLGQGVPFFHAGDDLLRSKSGDRNSYNSGDWFNKIDWTHTDNNWGVGLPPESQDRAAVLAPLLADPALKPTGADILTASEAFREMLRIRRSSPLFRLRTADDVNASLTFANTGPDQIPGLIVMTLADRNDLDTTYDRIVVLFNANQAAVNYAAPGLRGVPLALHPVLLNSADPIVRTAAFDPGTAAFSIPGRTTAVFVLTDDEAAALPTPTATAAPATAIPRPTSAPTSQLGSTPTPASPSSPLPGGNTPLLVLTLTLLASIVGALWFVNRKPKK